MKTKFKGVLTLFIALIVQISFAQEKTISGVVSDETGPLPQVSVVKKGTTQGVETDFDGNYTIKAKAGDVLVFIFVGMETIEKKVEGSSNINITMKNDNLLEEVVVTALGLKKQKKSLGYAQQTVKAEDLVTAKQSDISNALAGKISGVQFVGSPSSGFNSSKIRLRGNIDVLYVLDGIRLQSADDINPEDMESMSVLKGAAATALYGPEGSNGVVILVSKKAKLGKASFTYDSSIEISNADFIRETQTEYGGGYSQTFGKFKYNAKRDPSSWAGFDGDNLVYYGADESWGPKLDGTLVRQWDSWVTSNPNFGKSTPWVHNGGLSEFYKTGINVKQNISFAKGGEDYKVKLGYLRNDRELTLPNAKRTTNRFSIGASLDLTSKVKASANVFYTDQNTLNNPTEGYGTLGSNLGQWWQGQLDVKKLRNYKQGGNVVSWNIKGPRDPKPKYWDSPYFELYENLKNGVRKSTLGNFDIDYAVTDNLSTNLSIKKTYNITEYNARKAFGGLAQPSYIENSRTKDRNLFTGNLSYTTKVKALDVTAISGFEISNYTEQFKSAKTSGGLTIPGFYSIETSENRPVYKNRTYRKKGRAAYVTTSLGYNDWVFLDASLRKDWSSTANPENNGVITKGTSLSFIVSDLLPENNVLTYAKIRGGVAEAPKFPRVYRLSNAYDVLDSYARPKNKVVAVTSTQDAISNPLLEGGTRSEFEIGTELQFFNNRFGLDLTYFTKVDNELPVSVDIDPTKGYLAKYQNEGKQTYKGFEIGLSTTPVRNENFKWTSNLNFATLSRFVNKVSNTATQSDVEILDSRWGGLLIRNENGKEWGAVYGRKIKEIDGKKVISTKGTYVTEDAQYLGNYLPDFTGGFSNTFKYRNLALTVDTDFQVGGKYFSTSEMFINYSGLGMATVGDNEKGNPTRDLVTGADGEARYVLEDGKPVYVDYIKDSDSGANSGGTLVKGVDKDGNEVAYYKDTKSHWHNQFGNLSEFSKDASYLSIRNIKLSYSFNNEIVEKIGLSSLNFGAYVNNAFLFFTSVKNIDPSQIEQAAAGESNGFVSFKEGGQHPGNRTYGFNIQLKF